MHVVMLTLGYGFVALGIAGLFLPFLQGFLFLFLGLVLLARHAAWARRALEWTKGKHPKAGAFIARVQGTADRWERRVEGWFRSKRLG